MTSATDTRRAVVDSAYRRDYNRGWRAGGNTGSFTLDRADSRGESDAWYDGYHDCAAGRAKWHRPYCPNHYADGCGEA